MKTSELSGAALDWAVAKCEGVINESIPNPADYIKDFSYAPSTDWVQGGPIIERERIELIPKGPTWDAMQEYQHIPNEGPTPLIAAMRCYVTSKLGDEIDVPKELT